MLKKIQNWAAKGARHKVETAEQKKQQETATRERIRACLLLSVADEILSRQRSVGMLERLPNLLQASKDRMVTMPGHPGNETIFIPNLPQHAEVIEDLEWKGHSPYRTGVYSLEMQGPRILSDFRGASGRNDIYEEATYIEDILLYAVHRVPTLISNPQLGLSDLRSLIDASGDDVESYSFDAGADHPVFPKGNKPAHA